MDFTTEHLEKVKSGVILFNQKKYWECHEVLEDHWLEDRGDPCRDVYWAIIQVAAAMFHYREKNLTGVVGMHYKALDKLERCERNYVESQLLRDALAWDEFKKLVRSVPEKAKLEDFDQLYAFKFPSPEKW